MLHHHYNTGSFKMHCIAIFRVIAAFTCVGLLLLNLANGQTISRPMVNITVNILPPYSPYYADYTGINASKVLLIVQNMGERQLRIKLAGQLTGDNGVKISTYSNYVPLQPITLNAHETKQLSRQALKDVFDLNNLSVLGIQKTTLAQTSRLPEGNYSFCLQAYDYNSNALLSSNAPLGCTNLSIIYPDAPVLINPLPGSNVRALPVQSIMLNWINPSNVPVGTQYKIEMAEMPANAVSPAQVLNATSLPILSAISTTTSYNYDIRNLGLTVGKRYAWRVTAIDPNQRVTFKNNGTSAAAYFVYDGTNNGQAALVPPPGKVSQAPPAGKGRTYDITGMLTYRYHISKAEVQPDFNGRADTAVPLKNTLIELRYGKCVVDMKIVKRSMLDTNTMNINGNKGDNAAAQKFMDSLKQANSNKTAQQLTNSGYVTDSIPYVGVPKYYQVTPADDLGDNSEVLAISKTDAGGNYEFNFKTDKPPRIINTVGNLAYIYCYYINVVNKHYTDPVQYFYVQPGDPKSPDYETEVSSLVTGTQNVFVKNYNLVVSINRSSEGGVKDASKQNASVESNPDEEVQVYILHKGYPTTDIPADEVDNTGRQIFTPKPEAQKYFNSGNYYVVGKRNVYLNKDFMLFAFNFNGQTSFSNLVDNLKNTEDYYVYAEYKNNKVFFAPQEINEGNSVDDEDFYPTDQPVVKNAKIELQPTMVQVVVKGVMKYKFKNAAPKVFANAPLTLESVFFSLGPDKKIVYDFANVNKLNQIYASTTTDANGSFELGGGDIKYSLYKAGVFPLGAGFAQFVRVNSIYYGSPDNNFNFEAGNTYNVGELVARVNDYTASITVRGQNTTDGKMIDLPGQRVYLCRKQGFNGQLVHIPSDEGTQINLPQATVTDVNKNTYNVIGYAQTNSEGKVVFDRLVVNDPYNSADNYWLYSESGILSTSNYSTEEAETLNVTGNTLTYKELRNFPISNQSIDNVGLKVARWLYTTPQKPYIEGAVYPFSNESTNALSGVDVYLYDVVSTATSDNPYSAAKFDDAVHNLKNGMDAAAVRNQWMFMGKLKEQAHQKTTGTGRFRFDDPETTQFPGWKLLLYVKNGFITGYDKVNSGMPLKPGFKDNIKGFLYPPRLLSAYVKDRVTGAAVPAKVIVGDNFSWSHTMMSIGPKPMYTVTQLDTMRSTYGWVDFTVIPDDNVNYKTQKFTRYITAPATVGNKTKSDTKSTPTDDFLMDRPVTQVNVTIKDAGTGKLIPGTVDVLGLQPNEGQPFYLSIYPDFKAKIQVVTKMATFNLRVKSPGYVTQTLTILNSADPTIVKELTVQLDQGLSINGYVTVNKVAASGVKVYIKELEDQVPEVITNNNGYYEITGLPINYNTVNVVATAPASYNAIGEVQQTVLSYPPGKNGKQPNHYRVVSFDLQKNDKGIDFTKLYGFPFELEQLFQRFDGSMAVSGRIILPANNHITNYGGQKYLHVHDIGIVKNSNNRGGSALKPLEPANADVKLVEKNQNVTIFSKYLGSMHNDDGLVLHPLDAKLSTGTVQGALILTPGGFTKNIDWHYYPYLLPAADYVPPVNLNGIETPGKPGDAQAGMQFNPKNQPPLPAQQNGGQTQQKNNALGGMDIGNELVNYNFDDSFSDLQAGLIKVGDINGKPKSEGYNPGNAPNKAPLTNIIFSNPADDKINNYNISPSYGAKFNYTLNNLYGVDAGSDSRFDATGAHLFSTIHTVLNNVANPDLALNTGDLVYTDKPFTGYAGKKDIDIPLDSWRLNGKWNIANGPIKLTGHLFAGSITLPVTDMEVSPTDVGYGDIDVKSIGLAGVYKMKIDPNKTQTSFGFDKAAKYGTMYDPKYGCWSLSLLSNNEDTPVTQLANLPDLASWDLIKIMNISLYSRGSESRIVLMPDHPAVTVNGFASYIPYQAENGSDYLILHGALDLHIPVLAGLGNTVYDMDFAGNGTQLIHKPTPLPPLSLVTNGVRVTFRTDSQVFTNNKAVLVGNLQDKVPNSPYNFTVRLTKTNTFTGLIVTPNKTNIIDLGGGQLFTNVSGLMVANPDSWNNFNFQGDIVGAEGIREQAGDAKAGDNTKKTHIAYEVKGDLVANKTEIGVKNMKLGDNTNMNFTYDFTKKAIVGSMHIEESTPRADIHSDVEMQMGGGQWYMLGKCTIDHITGTPIPINGAGGAMCVGKCSFTPEMKSIIQSQFHDGVLPNGFDSKFGNLTGLLTVTAVDINLPIVPDIDFNLGPIAKAKVEKGIYCNSYQRLTFEDHPIVDGGLKVGAYVKVSAGASVLVGCAGLSLSAEMNGQVNTEIVLPTYKEMLTLNPVSLLNNTKITMNAEQAILLGGSAYIGYGVCDDDCSSIKVWGVKVPPGCHKKGIDKDMTIKYGIDVFKNFNTLTPDKSDIYFTIFGKTTTKNINIPHLTFNNNNGN